MAIYPGTRITSGFPAALVCLTLITACGRTAVDARSTCEAFANTRVGDMQIETATVRADVPDLPEFCAVEGQISPHIGFAARLPLAGWNGKYYQSGCGGYCGAVLPDKPGFSNTINEALKLGFAAITTDAGHSGSLGDASWAKDNPVAVSLYAEESIPLTYAAGVKLVTAFYGKAPQLEYFGGCSNGGRMAAKAAQQYPDLFDGILGGGAVLNLSQNGGLHGSWIVQSNTRSDGSRIIDRQNFAARLPLLQEEILSQCDNVDGLADGIIGKPRSCTVDVSVLPRCAADDVDACFTDAELGVLASWYGGARDSSGRQLYPGVPPGSEPFWVVWFLDHDGRVAPGNALGGDYARYLGFDVPVADDYTALDFDFDRDPPKLVANGRLLDALNPNLREFRGHGGKYLMWHGWQDPLVLPDQSAAYYESVVEELGGRPEVDSFMRLFMIPGQGHCWEIPGTAPDRFNPIVVLDSWVETGTAPDKLIAFASDPDAAEIDAAALCPYPAAAQFFATTSEANSAECRADSGVD